MLYWILNNGQKNGFGIYKDKKMKKIRIWKNNKVNGFYIIINSNGS